MFEAVHERCGIPKAAQIAHGACLPRPQDRSLRGARIGFLPQPASRQADYAAETLILWSYEKGFRFTGSPEEAGRIPHEGDDERDHQLPTKERSEDRIGAGKLVPA